MPDLAKSPTKVLESLDYPGSLLENSSHDCMRFMLSRFEGKEALKEKAIRMLCKAVITAGDERREKSERDPEKPGTRCDGSCSWSA